MAQPVFSLSQHTRHELFDRIIRSLNNMPEEMRKAFVLSHYQGCANEEIAGKIGAEPKEIPGLLKEANILFFENVRRFRIDQHK